MFALVYAKALRFRRRREEEIADANSNLVHNSKMLVYDAADFSYRTISSDFERDKVKKRATFEEEEGLSVCKNLVQVDNNGLNRLRRNSPGLKNLKIHR